jgi:hypothetical protein
MFTSDTWSAVAIWIRNVLLNQALLISIFLCILSFPHMLAPSVRLIGQPSVHGSGNAETVAAPGPVRGRLQGFSAASSSNTGMEIGACPGCSTS